MNTLRFPTETIPAPSGNGQHQRVPVAPRARDVRQLAIGLLLVVGSALAFLAWTNGRGGRQPVLAVARPVAAGEVLTAADVTQVRVALAPGLQAIAASRRGATVGRRVAVDLVQGTLLAPGQLGETRRLAPGRAVIGLALKAGQFPEGLRAGDPVLVVHTAGTTPVPGAADGSSVPPASGNAARVVSIGPARDQTGATLVSLELDAAQAPALATAATAGQFSLVLVGGS